jgi:hypothetical protein
MLVGNLHADDQWVTYSLNSDLDNKALNAVQMNRNSDQVRYLPSAKRDEHLKSIFKNHVSTFDDFELEILYKKLIYIKFDKLKNKYSFLNEKNHHDIMNAFFNDNYYFRGEMRPGQYLYHKEQY